MLPATCSEKYSITQQTVLELLNCFLRDDRGGGTSVKQLLHQTDESQHGRKLYTQCWFRVHNADISTNFFCMSFDELDRTTRFIHEAKASATAVLHEKAPKLTTLEKAMWVKLKRGEDPSR